MADEELPSYTPQAISDILPIYRPEDSDGQIQTYSLRQVSSNIQSVSPKDQPISLPKYQIRAFATGGFMNKKPHIIISKTNMQNEEHGQSSPEANNSNNRTISTTSYLQDTTNQRISRRFSVIPRRDLDSSHPHTPSAAPREPDPRHQVAEARFSIHGTDTIIDYSYNPRSLLILENSQAQILRTTINGIPHWWRPFPGNKSVLELLTSTEEIVARFIYAVPTLMSTGAAIGRKHSVAADAEVGELHIVEALAGGENGREEIICSAAVVIERAKRRAANIGRQGIGFKQGAACEPTTNCYYGGGV
ncbi:MAG: hypothetical protein Q9217_003917 [Psora testacea]